MKILSLLLSVGLASAGPTSLPRRQDVGAATTKKLVVSSPGQVAAYEFNGAQFKPIGTPATEEGKHFSWLVFKEPNHLYGANENANETRHWTVEDDGTIKVVGDVIGSTGVVHTAFNKDKNVIVGAAYGNNGTIDVWDVAEDGSLKLKKTLQVPQLTQPGANPKRQEAPHNHQANLDPTGGYFAINDLGSDKIHVLSTKDYELVNHVDVEAGCGPRHGGFVGEAGKQATHYMVVCELSNKIQVFGLTYEDTSVQFQKTQTISTFKDDTAPAGAAAGELVISNDSSSVYVTNRLTGDEADNIAYFSFTECGNLEFKQTVSTAGKNPRMASLSTDQSILFSTNLAAGEGDNTNRLVAYSRSKEGALSELPVALEELSATEKSSPDPIGPSFIQEIS